MYHCSKKYNILCNGGLYAVDRTLLLDKSVRLSSAIASQALMCHYNIGRLDVA